MHKTLLAAVAAAAVAAAGSLVSQRADAMTVGTASGIQAAAADTGMIEDVAYVCRHRGYSSRRVCYWTPGPRPRPWRYRDRRGRR